MDDLLLLLRRIFDNPLHGLVSALIIGLSVAFALGSIIFELLHVAWVSNFLQGVSTNMIGALLIFLLIELFWGQAKELQQLHQEMRSSNNRIAVGAIEKARLIGILEDGSLHRQAFWGANWEGANLSGAKLRGAALVQANLKGANMRNADLRGVDFSWAQFDTSSVLPDGSHWQSDEDLERFR